MKRWRRRWAYQLEVAFCDFNLRNPRSHAASVFLRVLNPPSQTPAVLSYASAGTRTPRANKLAIVALYLSVFGLPLGCVASPLLQTAGLPRMLLFPSVASTPFLALALGVISVIRIRRSELPLDGKEESYFAIVISILWIAAYGCLWAVFSNIDFQMGPRD